MSQLLIVVDSDKDWAPYCSSESVITFENYLELPPAKNSRVRVLNLCGNLRYLSKGYYCSLLAEGRGQPVVPSVKTIMALCNQKAFAVTQASLNNNAAGILKKLGTSDSTRISFCVFFGKTSIPELKELAWEVFDQFPCPILKVALSWQNGWRIENLKPVPLRSLNEDEQTEFANALDRFSHLLWRTHKSRLGSLYDMAILVDPAEKLPPSDEKALKKFVKVGQRLGIDVDFVGRRDLRRLPEYDMLFLRETTAINHHSFQFARFAESEGLVVIDDPQSIIRCTNKVYLADLFARKGVPTPKTLVMFRDDKTALDTVAEELGFPLVLKIPDGSFSRGVVRVENAAELKESAAKLFRQSALLLAQEFLYTEFDWRIGVLHGKPLYACKYFMARNHWQIYNHSARRFASGGFSTIPTYEAPKHVVAAATKAAGLIGDGLYGVDIKQASDRVAVIEVNDNPSIEAGVEDAFLGDELYRLILQEFIDRVQVRRNR